MQATADLLGADQSIHRPQGFPVQADHMFVGNCLQPYCSVLGKGISILGAFQVCPTPLQSSCVSASALHRVPQQLGQCIRATPCTTVAVSMHLRYTVSHSSCVSASTPPRPCRPAQCGTTSSSNRHYHFTACITCTVNPLIYTCLSHYQTTLA